MHLAYWAIQWVYWQEWPNTEIHFETLDSTISISTASGYANKYQKLTILRLSWSNNLVITFLITEGVAHIRPTAGRQPLNIPKVQTKKPKIYVTLWTSGLRLNTTVDLLLMGHKQREGNSPTVLRPHWCISENTRFAMRKHWLIWCIFKKVPWHVSE